MKLSRFLKHHIQEPRNELKRMLAAGRVCVDGSVEKDGDCEIGDFTQVRLDGLLLRDRRAIYLMLHKPAGYLSATKDDQHPTVMELITAADEPAELHIAGRLDRASTGLLILTNDGKWSRRLTEPKEGVPKVYLVETSEPISAETEVLFRQGIYFAYEDVTTQPAELEVLSSYQARLSIYEGRYHQIKRMFHAVGNNVKSLHRVSVGNIHLDTSLAVGGYRHLSKEEVLLSMEAGSIVDTDDV